MKIHKKDNNKFNCQNMLFLTNIIKLDLLAVLEFVKYNGTLNFMFISAIPLQINHEMHVLVFIFLHLF